ncbi:MAG: energy-coupling factor transporter transmembrane component T [Anaerolineales bacterium]|jgi:energy-coupling factor transporter transmembrane protein EcfT
MTASRLDAASIRTKPRKPLVGSLGHLAIFLWSLGVVLITQLRGGYLLAGACVVFLALCYPSALRRILRPRWLILLGILLVISILFGGGKPDLKLWGFPISKENIIVGVKMTLSAIVILIAADGLASSMDITEVAGVFERAGLQGLGFSLGVAANQLPNLRQSSTNAWHSLRMRGGMRAQWWRGLQLLLLTILTNALRRSEDIVLAAEARAFRPDRSRTAPLRIGRLDWWLIPVGLLSLVGVFLMA